MQDSLLYIVLALLGVVIYLLLNPRKNRKETDDFEKTIKDLKTEIENYRKDDLKKQGSFEEALRNAQTDRQSFIEAAKELQQTLVSGGGQKQGAWGEMILKYILTEKLQFTEGQEFHIHENFDTEEGRLEPDVIIHLPGKRDAIVDSKVSLKAWNDYVNAKDDHSRKSALDEHRKSIKRHIDSLADKKYQNIKDLNTLDTVIMFYVNELKIWMRLVFHIPFIPVVAGLGYELLKLTAKYRNNIFFLALAKPGLWLQNITTKQPDDEQVEVALKALEEAFGDNLSQYTSGETYVAEAIG